MKYRDYVDSNEELKNPMVNIRKAMDAGIHHIIHLDDTEKTSITGEQANRLYSLLLLMRPLDRQEMLNTMFSDLKSFNKYKNKLLAH